MPSIEVNGLRLELSEDGFLADPQKWTREAADALAKSEEGLVSLTAEHWAVIDVIRDHYLKTNLAPMVRLICDGTGFALSRIYELFPSGPVMGACKIAGLPQPDGCV